MSVIQSNADAILVAVPMIGLLFAGYFRLDELFSKPKRKKSSHVRPFASLDESGNATGLDPDEVVPMRDLKAPVRRHRVQRHGPESI